MIWGMFMSATMKVAVHLRRNYQQNLRTTKNTNLDKIKHLFHISWKLILNQNQKIHGTSTIDLEYNSMCEKYFVERQSCRAVHSKGSRLLTFSALSRRQNCLVTPISEVLERPNWLVHAIPRVSWIGRCWENNSHDTLHCSYFKTSETRWRNIFGLTNSKIESSSRRCTSNSSDVAAYAAKCLKGHWSFSGPETCRKMVRNARSQTKRFVERCCWYDDGQCQRERTPSIQRLKCLLPRRFEKQRRWKNEGHIVTRTQRRQSCYFAALSPSISSLSTEQKRTGVKNLLSAESEEWIRIQSRNPRMYQSWPNHLWSMCKLEETRCSNTEKNSKTFQKIFEWVKLAKTLVLCERFLVDNILWQSMTNSWQDFDALVHVENTRLLEMMKDPKRKHGFEEVQKLARYWKSRSQITRNVVERKLRSIPSRTTKTQSWIVISSGIHKYVTELPEENKKPIHHEEVATGAGQLVAMKQKEQFIPSSSSSSSTIMPINQWRWNDISAVGRIDDKAHRISKPMTRLLWHDGYPREDDVATEICYLCFISNTLK